MGMVYRYFTFFSVFRASSSFWVSMPSSSMGMPIQHRTLAEWRSNRFSAPCMRRMGKRLTMKARQARPDRAWESTVAMAAPVTPARKSRMKAKSRPIFRMEARARK